MKKFISYLFLVFGIVIILFALDKYTVEQDKCIGCTLCVSQCPTQAIEIVDGKAIIDAEKCIGCAVCVSSCPTQAIVVAQAPAETEIPETDSLVINDTTQAVRDSLKK